MDYRALLKELKELQSKIQLDTDPISSGLNFNAQLAELQAVKERVSQILLEAIWHRQMKEVVYKKQKHKYETAYNKLITSEDIKELKSSDLRTAKARALLEQEREQLLHAELDFDIATTFYKTVQHVYDLLKSKNDNIINQIKVVQTLTGIDPSIKLKISK